MSSRVPSVRHLQSSWFKFKRSSRSSSSVTTWTTSEESSRESSRKRFLTSKCLSLGNPDGFTRSKIRYASAGQAKREHDQDDAYQGFRSIAARVLAYRRWPESFRLRDGEPTTGIGSRRRRLTRTARSPRRLALYASFEYVQPRAAFQASVMLLRVSQFLVAYRLGGSRAFVLGASAGCPATSLLRRRHACQSSAQLLRDCRPPPA